MDLRTFYLQLRNAKRHFASLSADMKLRCLQECQNALGFVDEPTLVSEVSSLRSIAAHVARAFEPFVARDDVDDDSGIESDEDDYASGSDSTRCLMGKVVVYSKDIPPEIMRIVEKIFSISRAIVCLKPIKHTCQGLVDALESRVAQLKRELKEKSYVLEKNATAIGTLQNVCDTDWTE